ncbi:hypothetical protein BXE05_22845 [Salmonella enterica subsp. enterica]|nr:hypothetical protein [Salmonella enterica]EBR0328379.1 hypothetical protein [Salmonella enterica subsp. enterica serovar Newport]EBW5252841.1 hypothetical protein [Salmonella enterica subsp. enterica serovar Newport]EBY2010917.1 hypothetical protein [Salmonella enterica subsp. enterica serovar Newport]MIV36523.1 hypothetical protein [Salmonella enterica subsp. enterica serovar Newport]
MNVGGLLYWSKNMLDLPQPTTKDECTAQAKQYAEYLLSWSTIKEMARLRLKIEPDEHPAWFIRYLDDQIARIKCRIEGLLAWNRRNPEHAAQRVQDLITTVYYLMLLAAGETRSAPVNPDDGRQWLMELIAKENHCQHCQG